MRVNQINASNTGHPVMRILNAVVMSCLLIAGLALSGCGDSPQAELTQSTNVTPVSGIYQGVNPPASPDTSSFMAEFWKPMREGGYCVECHDANQAPMFLNGADINVAYDFAKSKVDVLNPANSRLVDQVGRGHHCWLGSSNASNKACADIIQRYITNWLGAGSGAGRSIALTAPALVDPGNSKNFPATAQDNNANSFANTVYPLLHANCYACHAPASATPQAPFFADDDVNAAYEAAKAKMDLNEGTDSTDKSRFVLRLRNEFHNCWSGDCDADATEMRNAIIAFAGGITAIPIDISLVKSKAMTLQVPPAIIASGGNRYETGVIALWEFKEGSGTIAYDTSGVSPALDLDLIGDSNTPTWQWVNGYGVEFLPCPPGATCGKAQGDPVASKKLHDRILQTGEYSIEAWLVPANVTQDNRSIVTYSNGNPAQNRNFTMGQSMYNYDFINHTTKSNGTDNDKLSTADADEDLQATLQHVVMNFDPVNGRQIFVNGVSTGDFDISGLKGGSVTAWDASNPGYPLILGSEQGGGNTAWNGKIRMLAIYNRALTAEQIRQNYAVGVGQKYLLLFSVANPGIGVPDNSYIMFEAEQYDNYAYLFSSPKFINLDTNWTPSAAITIKGMRIAINGKEAVAGQAFANMDVTVNSSGYVAGEGQLLSGLGTVIASEKGVTDEFFLTFEQLGTATHAYVEANPIVPQAPADADMVSKIGVRTFDEINATMSAMTGVPVTNTSVKTTFDQYRRQLPAVEDIQAYLSSHQMGVAQLAMKYCDALVETNPGFFAPFSFNQLPSAAFDATGKNNVLTPLLTSIVNVEFGIPVNNLVSQPSETVMKNLLSSTTPQVLGDGYSQPIHEFDSLMDCMTRCERGMNECSVYIDAAAGDTAACTAGETHNTTTRTKQVVKATCAAMLGSAVMTIQ